MSKIATTEPRIRANASATGRLSTNGRISFHPSLGGAGVLHFGFDPGHVDVQLPFADDLANQEVTHSVFCVLRALASAHNELELELALKPAMRAQFCIRLKNGLVG